MAHGNPNVILCERGIRTFETATRNTCDIAAVPVLNELTHLPVILDPSHATGKRSLIPALSRAGVAIGADGLIVEVHPCPEKAVSDGAQSLTLPGFRSMMAELKPYIRLVDGDARAGRAVERGGCVILGCVTPKFRAWLLIILLSRVLRPRSLGSGLVPVAGPLAGGDAEARCRRMMRSCSTSISRRCARAASCNCWMAPRWARTPSIAASWRKTEFDYKQDLDAAMVAFAPDRASTCCSRGGSTGRACQTMCAWQRRGLQ